MLDLIRTLTHPPTETPLASIGELASKMASWLTVGFAILGFRPAPPVAKIADTVGEPIRRPRSMPVRPRPITIAPPSADAGPADVHMARLSGVVNRSLSGAERVVATHAAAMVGLDAAEYALNRLLDEIKGSMTPPIGLVTHSPQPMPKRPCLPTSLSALAA